MYLFGSQLIKKHFPDFRDPKDLDLVSNDTDEFIFYKFSEGIRREVYCIPCSPNREMTPDEIYTVKVSHAIYDIHWPKTMSDIRFLQLKGCKVDQKFLIDLREFWKTIHTGDKYKRFDFTAKENLFDDHVNRYEDHDQLHLLFSDEVLFKRFSDGFIPVKEKFETLDKELKNRICTDEAYVIALERFYGKVSMYQAYQNAQRLLITQLHPLFIADHAILNWNSIYKPKDDYYGVYERRHSAKT